MATSFAGGGNANHRMKYMPCFFLRDEPKQKRSVVATRYLILTSSTTNVRVEFGGIMPAMPCEP
jgi:hypothetical protein